MQIREALLGEEEKISELINTYANEDIGPWKHWTPRKVREKILFKNDFFLVHEDDSGMTGIVLLSLIDKDLADIRFLIVKEEERGKGIGSSLLEESLKFLKEKGIRKVITRVDSENTVSESLFKKHGFEEEGFFKNHYRKGVHIKQLFLFLK